MNYLVLGEVQYTDENFDLGFSYLKAIQQAQPFIVSY